MRVPADGEGTRAEAAERHHGPGAHPVLMCLNLLPFLHRYIRTNDDTLYIVYIYMIMYLHIYIHLRISSCGEP